MSQVTFFVICFPMGFLMGALRSRLSLQPEVAAFRHQLSVYQGMQRRPPISSCDRERVEWLAQGLVLCAALGRPGVATRRLPRPLAWAVGGGGSRGRPSIPQELRRLIRCMWQASPTWGSSDIVSEHQELGIDTAKSTVETYQSKLRGPTPPSWATFLRWHIQDIVAIDFFIVRDGCGQRPALASHRRLRRPVHQR